MVEADRFVRGGHWRNGHMSESRRIAGRTVGIVGLGKIGRAIARKACALGMSVMYTGPRPKPDVAYPFCDSVRALAEHVNTLVVSCPGGAATQQEPAIDPRFRSLENVVLQPHYAAITHEMRIATTQRLCREIRAFVGGQAFSERGAGRREIAESQSGR